MQSIAQLEYYFARTGPWTPYRDCARELKSKSSRPSSGPRLLSCFSPYSDTLIAIYLRCINHCTVFVATSVLPWRPMLTAVRRGSASITRLAYLPSPSPRSFRSIISPATYRLVVPTKSASHRPFSFSSPAQQRAATAEAEYIEDEIADEASAQRPPSEAQINDSIQRGPIVKFKELGERGLVCPTVVRTLTNDMGMETMTQVQSLTINETLKGIDV